MKRYWPVLLVLFFILATLSWDSFYFFMHPGPVKPSAPRIVRIVPGMSLLGIAHHLDQEEIIHDPYKFIFLAWAKGLGKKIQWGDFELYAGMPPLLLLEYLSTGKNMIRRITIPEGFTLQQIAHRLEEEKLVEEKSFLALARNQKWIAELNLEGPSLEGYLFPDTYIFHRGMSPEEIQKKMVQRFNQIMGSFPPPISPAGNLSTRELVTLASIVEKESGLASERPLIASVFYNRLKKGMPLQSDPTVIYGLDDFNGNLKKKDLLRPTGYNTYRITGLPPGPIANPGRDALQAVLSPAHSDYLYFVSKNNGSHYFSKDLHDHNRAVALYQLSRKENR
ncbi:MAG TPA: endolytic transglycosylase MltG [Thermodesulfobacteriota bacterium]|nr:endolytic transglycosylase MltG [Thermodesulfobacteriota bacterium]